MRKIIAYLLMVSVVGCSQVELHTEAQMHPDTVDKSSYFKQEETVPESQITPAQVEEISMSEYNISVTSDMDETARKYCIEKGGQEWIKRTLTGVEHMCKLPNLDEMNQLVLYKQDHPDMK